MELDHVLFAVAELAAAGREIEVRHGLSSVEGGRHPAWGTANWIVPLGGSYLELVSVVDSDKARSNRFGRWVASGVSETFQPLGWAVRTSALDEVAQRLGLPVQAGSRTTPDGDQLRWRSAGVDMVADEPLLPFFIQWEPGTKHPGRVAATHRAGDARITRLDVHGDTGRLADWLGSNQLPLVVQPGKAAVAKVHIACGERTIVLPI